MFVSRKLAASKDRSLLNKLNMVVPSVVVLLSVLAAAAAVVVSTKITKLYLGRQSNDERAGFQSS